MYYYYYYNYYYFDLDKFSKTALTTSSEQSSHLENCRINLSFSLACLLAHSCGHPWQPAVSAAVSEGQSGLRCTQDKKDKTKKQAH